MALQRKKGARVLATVAAVAMFATACSSEEEPAASDETTEDAGGEETDGEESPDDGETASADGYCSNVGGTLVWTHEQEPENMHLDDPANNKSITSWIRASLWEGLYGIASDITYQPELLAEPLEVVDNGDGTYTFNGTLRDGLMWSDGTPLTTEQVAGTFDIIMEGWDYEAANDDDPETDPAADAVYLTGSRNLFDQVTEEGIVIESDTEFSFTMTSFNAGYPAFLGEIFPTHVVPDAATANEVFQTFELADGTPLPSAGPMLWDQYTPGSNLTLVRNPDYHGSVSPDAVNDGIACIDGVEIVFAADTDAQVNSLLAGEADIISAQPQTAFLQLAESPDFTVLSSAGPVYEHWSFNLQNPHLADPNVREALAYGIDKGEVVRTLYAPLFGDLLPEAGLGQTYWMTNQPPYVDYQAEYDGAQVDAATAALETAGYTLGDDGVYTHPERGRLSLRVGTTGGNRLREDQQQLIQSQLANAGIEIVIDNVQGSAYFSDRPFSEGSIACYTGAEEGADCTIWDIAQFAWVGGPWPGSGHCTYQTQCGNNLHSFSDPEFDARTTECDAILDDAERADCYNELAEWTATLNINPEQGLVVVPLTQKPNFYAFSNVKLTSGAVSPDMQGTGPLANVVDYIVAP